MATIPLGNFGNAIAGPAPRVNIPQGAYNTGDGLQQVGEAITKASMNMLAGKREEENALTRAKLANAALDREIEIDSIADEIDAGVSSGQLGYKDAGKAFKERVSKLKAPEDLKTADPVTAENFNRQIKRLDFKGEGRIGGIVAKAQQGEMRASVDGLLDKLGKKAGMPGTDMESVSAQVSAMDEIGRQAYGAGWEKRKQDWSDNSWNARLNQEAMLSRDSLQSINELQKRITEGDYSEKIDSDKRNTLVAKLDGYKTSLIQRQEAAASRAARQQEIVMRRAEAEFNTFQGLADKGTILSPEYIDRAYQMTAGTPYQAGIAALAQQAQEAGGLASQPLQRQREMLAEIDRTIAQRGRSPELDKRREQANKILSGIESDIKQEGIRAGIKYGAVTDVTPIDLSSPEAISSSIVERMREADMVSAWNGRPVSPLDAVESDQLREMLDRLPARQRAQAIATISQSVGPKYSQAIALQLDEKDRPLALAFASAGTMTSAGRYTSEMILKGAAAAKDGLNITNAFGVAKNDVKAQIAEQIDGIPMVDERASQSIKDAAYYIALSMAKEEGSVSGGDIERAVRLAVGGNVIDRNGKRLPIPANMSAEDFDAKIKNIRASDIIKQLMPSNTGDVKFSKQQESDFQSGIRKTEWFKEFVKEYGEEPDLDTKDYNYRKAWAAGVRPVRDKFDGGRFHWQSSLNSGEMLKSENHNTAWKEHYMRATGKNPDEVGATKADWEKISKPVDTYTVRAGGVEIDAATFAKSIPGQELSPVSPGHYMVMVGGRPVVNAQGRPIIVKVD